MKRIKMGIIAVLAMVGLVLLASEPSEGANWFAVMFWKSLAGFGCWGLVGVLCRKWGVIED